MVLTIWVMQMHRGYIRRRFKNSEYRQTVYDNNQQSYQPCWPIRLANDHEIRSRRASEMRNNQNHAKEFELVSFSAVIVNQLREVLVVVEFAENIIQ